MRSLRDVFAPLECCDPAMLLAERATLLELRGDMDTELATDLGERDDPGDPFCEPGDREVDFGELDAEHGRSFGEFSGGCCAAEP